MAKRRSKSLRGLPSEHADIANATLKRVKYATTSAEDRAKSGDCRNAIRRLGAAYEHLGGSEANAGHANGQVSATRLRDARVELEQTTSFVISACGRSR
jgi:hypothetical protein